MELKQLQYFVAVAEHLNFSRAAESLYISQPRLSYQIAELERELGALLFTRDRRKVFLTPAGGALLPLALKILECSQEIRSMATQGFPDTERLLSLSVAFDRTEDHFESAGATSLVARFSADYPDVELKLQQASLEDCVKLLDAGMLDVAFLVLRHNETLPANLNCKTIFEDRLMLVCKQDDEVHDCVEALRKYNLISVEDHPHGLSRVLWFFEREGLDISPITVDSIPASFAYVQAGKGSIFLPKNYFDQHGYKDLRAYEIPSPAASLRHVLAWNKTHPNPCIQRLVSLVDDHRPGKTPEKQKNEQAHPL